MSATDQRAMQAYLDRPLDDLLDELSVYDTTRGTGDVWRKIAGPVRNALVRRVALVRAAPGRPLG